MESKNALGDLTDTLELVVGVRARPLRMRELVALESALREVIVQRTAGFRQYIRQLEARGFEDRPWSDNDEPPFPLDDITREGLGVLTPEELIALAGDKHCLDVLRDVVLDDPFTDDVHEEWQNTLVASVERGVNARRAEGPKSSDAVATDPE